VPAVSGIYAWTWAGIRAGGETGSGERGLVQFEMSVGHPAGKLPQQGSGLEGSLLGMLTYRLRRDELDHPDMTILAGWKGMTREKGSGT
jgi:hypothetical protein